MGVLEEIATGRRVRLRADHLVGRSGRADLRLDDRRVSAEHAKIRWSGRGWVVRDLGSRNGTWVAGERLEAGGAARLEAGGTVSFGSDGASHRLVVGEAPTVFATEADGAVHVGAGGMLALPSDDDPEVVILASGDGWVVEGADGERPVADGEELVIGDRRFTVTLPTAPDGTWDPAEPAGCTLSQLALHFRVSIDEEHVELAVDLGDGPRELGSRAHHYVLLVLARLRLEDAARGELPDSACGWIVQEQLERMLARSGRALHVAVFRARRELAELGVTDAQDLVERRRGARQLRIGVSRVLVETI